MFTIHSRKLNRDITFSLIGDFGSKHYGYVYVDLNGKEGYLGNQICKGGYLMGSTIMSTDENFERVCKNWLRLYYKNNFRD